MISMGLLPFFDHNTPLQTLNSVLKNRAHILRYAASKISKIALTAIIKRSEKIQTLVK